MSDTETVNSQGPIRPARLAVVVLDGPDSGGRLELERGTYCIGKDPHCDLVLTDRGVSRQHLELVVEVDGIRVRDLGSKNGTYLEGVRVHEVLVGAGALLRVGTTSLRVVTPLDDAKLTPSAATAYGELYGESLAMRTVFAVLERVAESDVAVLVSGETGTGKELCAEAIHSHSPRAGKPFVVCDMAAMTGGLIESELFGHMRGAFTGADRDHAGLFAAAEEGTLFIDEIGELGLPLQPRLLRALEQRQYRPLGGKGYRQANVRVVAATNRDLREEVAAGRFREDLYHRLAVVTVRLPPLRERRSDIPALVRRFVGDRPLHVLPETLAVLTEYDWPGNVRELKNVIDAALARLGGGDELTPSLLGLSTPAAHESMPWPKIDQPGFFEAKERLIATWERNYLRELLQRCDGNVSRAARESGIGRNYLHRMLKRHGLSGASE